MGTGMGGVGEPGAAPTPPSPSSGGARTLAAVVLGAVLIVVAAGALVAAAGYAVPCEAGAHTGICTEDDAEQQAHARDQALAVALGSFVGGVVALTLGAFWRAEARGEVPEVPSR